MTGDSSPRVSVIIPSYNRADFIRQTVDSVLQQTFKDIELIAVDDGSSDETRYILAEYGDRIILLGHDGWKNKGQSASINLGLRHAKGKYIAILDSDDYWDREKIEIQLTFLESNPDIGLVYCNGVAVNGTGEYLYDIYPPGHHEKNDPSELLVNCYIFLPTNAMCRTALFDKTGYFDENLRSAQDHDMAVRLIEICKFAYLDRKLFAYRRHQHTISQKNADLRWKNGFLILDKARRRYPYGAKTLRKRKAVLHFRLAQCYREKIKLFPMLLHLLLSGLYDPKRAFYVLRGAERITSHH